MQPRLRHVLVALALLAAVSGQASAQPKKPKTGLNEEDWKYTLANGVTTREVNYYSDDTACYAKMFFPKGFSPKAKVPGVVLGQGWAGTHYSIEKYGARFAERGLVAMVIDYRGWGMSSGFLSLAEKLKVPDDVKYPDDVRFTRTKAEVVSKRTRLIPLKQVEDYRSAISFLQGEPGVDRDRIGIWGSSYAGGHVIVTAALDARVKAIVGQVPSIGGKSAPPDPRPMSAALLEDAIKRARTGQGEEYNTGFSTRFRRKIDVETQQMVAEYRPFHYLNRVGKRPVLFIVAEKEELMNNRDHAYAAAETLQGPKKVLEIPAVTHFEMYIDEAFEKSSNAAADWFLEHLGVGKP